MKLKATPAGLAASMHVKISGEFRVVLNAGTDRESDSGWMKNMVLDAGLDRLGVQTNHQVITHVSVGTGSTAVSSSQTSLVSHLASKAGADTNTTTNLGASTYTTQTTLSFVYPQGAVVGNITELGVGWATGGGSLFSRSLIVNGSGVPTALTVVALDQLTVFWRVNVTPVITDLSSSVTISGTPYSYTGRLSNATSFATNFGSTILTSNSTSPFAIAAGIGYVLCYGTGATIGAITTTPSGASSVSGTSTRSLAAYTNGNFYQDTTITLAPADHNSTGGIKCLKIGTDNNFCQWQYQFTTAIPKDNTKTLTLVIRVSWSR